MEIDAQIRYFPAHEFRKFYAAAAKFLIPSRNWNDRHPVSAFDHEAIVGSFHAGFDTYFEPQMRGHAALPAADRILLSLIRKAANPPTKRWSKRDAGKKMTRLTCEIKKRFNQYIPRNQAPIHRLSDYEHLVRHAYFG